MTAEHKERCQKKPGKKLLLIALVGGAFALTVGLLGSCGRGHCGRHMSAERIEKFVSWKVDDLLDDIDATDAQRDQVGAIAQEIVQDVVATKKEHKGKHSEFIDALSGQTLDRQRIAGMIDLHFGEMKALVDRSADRMLDAYELLDARQRAEVLSKIEEHVKDKK